MRIPGQPRLNSRFRLKTKKNRITCDKCTIPGPYVHLYTLYDQFYSTWRRSGSVKPYSMSACSAFPVTLGGSGLQSLTVSVCPAVTHRICVWLISRCPCRWLCVEILLGVKAVSASPSCLSNTTCAPVAFLRVMYNGSQTLHASVVEYFCFPL